MAGLGLIVSTAWAGGPAAEVVARAEAGDAGAQIQLAIAYAAGEYGADEISESAKWASRAEEAGSAQGSVMLGLLYEMGRGVPQDYGRARKLFEEAAGRGLAEGKFQLGLMFFDGWGVQKDRDHSLSLIKEAAEAGFVPAMKLLAKVYHFGMGVTADAQSALYWAEQAARSKDPEAEMLLGITGMARKTANRGDGASREWLRLSAEQEYTMAMVVMAHSYLKGLGGKSDPDLARKWLELAIENGDSDAGFFLACHEAFVDSRKRPFHPEVALKWLQKASALGCFPATEVLALVEEGRLIPDALTYVITVPQVDRYVAHAAREAAARPGGDRQPQVIYMVKPEYPPALRLTGEEGEAVVEFVVQKDGSVAHPSIHSSENPAFNEPALAAVAQWRFVPGIKKGAPVNCRMRVPVHFNLSLIREPAAHAPAAGQSR